MSDVVFKNIRLRYTKDHEVLRNLSFSLAQGSFHFITGASGAGKSSILNLILSAIHPNSGTIEVFGKNLKTVKRKDVPYLRRKIGVVLQDFHLINHLSAFDNVALPLRIDNVPEANIKKHVYDLLKWVGLSEHMNSKLLRLSGGEKQRIAIARAVIKRPQLLLADEPTGNVDAQLAQRLLLLFEHLNRYGTTVLIATHDETLISNFNKPVMTLKNGSIN